MSSRFIAVPKANSRHTCLMMKRPIRVLLIEDEEEEVLRVLAELRRGDFEVDLVRVAQNASDLRAALCKGSWDIVLCSHSVSDFDCREALRIVRGSLPDIPFIILSDPESEESAVEAMKAGAQDYLLKDNLTRLVPVVERELREAEERRARRNAEKAVIAQLQEFRIGREIQQRLFPAAAPVIEGFDIAGVSHPAAATGGDYFDYIRMRDGSVLIVAGDVAGHGVGPALLMADVRACLRALSQMCDDPAEILCRANKLLLEDLGAERFVTILLAKLVPSEGMLSYVNAGHAAGCVLGSDGCLRQELVATVPALGLFPFSEQPKTVTISLREQELVLLFTDGLIEATTPGGEEFGLSRVLEVVRLHRKESASAIIATLWDALKRFTKEEPQQDDITMVVIKCVRTRRTARSSGL